MHDLLRISDLDAGELLDLLEVAMKAKADRTVGRGLGEGRAVAVLFEKPSLRTRFSVESALARIGAHPIGAYDREVGLGSRESIADAARTLERYVDAIVLRTFEQSRVEELAAAADVPVINALSDAHHPLQALADVMTVAEHRGGLGALAGTKVAWVGDGNNVAHSLVEACAKLGLPVALACPEGHDPDAAIVEAARADVDVTITRDPREAVAGADVVSTDVWASMGQEGEREDRARTFEPYRVTGELMAVAAPGAIFLHCLPAHRGEEVGAEVIDGPASRVFDQAENRLHTTLAVFVRLFGSA